MWVHPLPLGSWFNPCHTLIRDRFNWTRGVLAAACPTTTPMHRILNNPNDGQTLCGSSPFCPRMHRSLPSCLRACFRSRPLPHPARRGELICTRVHQTKQLICFLHGERDTVLFSESLETLRRVTKHCLPHHFLVHLTQASNQVTDGHWLHLLSRLCQRIHQRTPLSCCPRLPGSYLRSYLFSSRSKEKRPSSAKKSAPSA